MELKSLQYEKRFKDMKNFYDLVDEMITAEVLAEMVSECNSYNGSLERYVYYDNDDDFFEMFFSDNINEAVRASHYGDYSYTDEYVQFNAYGNLDSVTEWERKEELEDNRDEILSEFIELVNDGSISGDYLNIDIDELIEASEEE